MNMQHFVYTKTLNNFIFHIVRIVILNWHNFLIRFSNNFQTKNWIYYQLKAFHVYNTIYSEPIYRTQFSRFSNTIPQKISINKRQLSVTISRYVTFMWCRHCSRWIYTIPGAFWRYLRRQHFQPFSHEFFSARWKRANRQTICMI